MALCAAGPTPTSPDAPVKGKAPRELFSVRNLWDREERSALDDDSDLVLEPPVFNTDERHDRDYACSAAELAAARRTWGALAPRLTGSGEAVHAWSLQACSTSPQEEESGNKEARIKVFGCKSSAAGMPSMDEFMQARNAYNAEMGPLLCAEGDIPADEVLLDSSSTPIAVFRGRPPTPLPSMHQLCHARGAHSAETGAIIDDLSIFTIFEERVGVLDVN